MNDFVWKVLTYSLIPIVIGIINYIVFKSNDKELLANHNKSYIIVHSPKIYKWIGILGSVFFLFLFILYINTPDDEQVLGMIVTSILFLLGISIIIIGLVWKIRIFKDQDYMIYTTFFSRTYKIPYSQIDYYKEGRNTLIFKFKKKKFFVDTYSANYDDLLKMFRKYRVKEHIKKYKW